MKTETFGAIGLVGLVAWLLLALTMLIGWTMNLFKLAYQLAEFAALTDSEVILAVLRVLGAFLFPLGAILGLFA